MEQAKRAVVTDIEYDEQEINFAVGQVLRLIHNCNREFSMSVSSKEAFAHMIKILADNEIRLSAPIAHIVKQDWDLETGADACKYLG